MKTKLIPMEQRNKYMRCWFCRTNKSIKHYARMINTNPYSENRYMNVLVCKQCANFHKMDFIDIDN